MTHSRASDRPRRLLGGADPPTAYIGLEPPGIKGILSADIHLLRQNERSCFYIGVRKGVRTRRAIVDHAMRLASQVGLEALSIGGLSQSLGLSKSGLFAHFKSKENLQIAVIDSAAAVFIAHVVRPAIEKPRGEPRLRALFENWLTWSSRPLLPGGCLFVAAAMEYDDRPGPVRERLVETQEAWLGTMSRAAQIAIEEGHFRNDLDPRQLAFSMYGLLFASQVFRRLMVDPRALDYARTGFDRLLADARKQPPLQKRG